MAFSAITLFLSMHCSDTYPSNSFKTMIYVYFMFYWKIFISFFSKVGIALMFVWFDLLIVLEWWLDLCLLRVILLQSFKRFHYNLSDVSVATIGINVTKNEIPNPNQQMCRYPQCLQLHCHLQVDWLSCTCLALNLKQPLIDSAA